MKICRGCQQNKELSEFYHNCGMPDGHLNHCKMCVNQRVRAYRKTPAGKAAKKRDQIKHAEKYRDWKRAYKKTPKGRATTARYEHANYKPDREGAKSAIHHALRRGRLQRWPCMICGEKRSVAHHSSYDRDMRLAVTWLCQEHHNQLHMEHNRSKALSGRNVERGRPG